jgi:hypothetical protein
MVFYQSTWSAIIIFGNENWIVTSVLSSVIALYHTLFHYLSTEEPFSPVDFANTICMIVMVQIAYVFMAYFTEKNKKLNFCVTH